MPSIKPKKQQKQKKVMDAERRLPETGDGVRRVSAQSRGSEEGHFLSLH